MQVQETNEAAHAGAAAVSALEAYSKKTMKWAGGLHYGAEVKVLENLVGDFKRAIKKCGMARDSIHMLSQGESSAKKAAKKDYHRNVSKVTAWIQANATGLPAPLCKAYGEMIYADALDPTSVGLTRLYQIPPLRYEAAETRDSLFNTPRLIATPDVVKGHQAPLSSDPFVRGVLNYIGKIRKTVLDRRIVQDNKLQSESKPSILGAEASLDPFPWNGVGDSPLPEFFKDVLLAPLVIITQRVMFTDLRLVSHPLRGHPHWFMMMVGSAVVLLLDPKVFHEHPDLISWMKTLDGKELQDMQGAVLYEGDAIYVPPGFIVVWVGLPPDVDLTRKNVKLTPRGKQAQVKR